MLSALVIAFLFGCEPATSAAAVPDPYADAGTEAMLEGIPLRDRNRAIFYLTNILKSDSDPETRLSAAQMLGRLAAFESARPLLENVELASSQITRTAPLARHHAAHALSQIGSNAYVDIRHYIYSNELSEKKAVIFAHIIKEIDGKDVGKFRIQQWLTEHQAAEARQNLTFVRNLGRISDLLSGDALNSPKNWPFSWTD